MTTGSDPAAFAANDGLLFTHSSSTTVKTLKDLIGNANGTGAYTYLQYDFRGLNGGDDNLNFKWNFTFGDSTIGQGGTTGDHTLFYGTTINTAATAAVAGVVAPAGSALRGPRD